MPLPVKTISRLFQTYLVKGTDEEIIKSGTVLRNNYPEPHYVVTRYNIANDETIFSVWKPYDLI